MKRIIILAAVLFVVLSVIINVQKCSDKKNVEPSNAIRDVNISPDDKCMVFSYSIKGNGGISSSIYSCEINSSNVKRLTFPKEDESHVRPTYAPDGLSILFLSYNKKDGSSSIYKCAADGSNAQRLTYSTNETYDNPSYSPDGSKMIFIS
jgi:Tol biopolymer transport system component